MDRPPRLNCPALLTLMFASISLLPTSARSQGQRSTEASERSSPTIVAGPIGKALDSYMQNNRRFRGGFSGCVLVATNGKIHLAKGYGVAHAASKKSMPADALWDWCSVTKQFTAAAVIKLQMLGTLDLDDSITKYFPDAPENKKAVTIRHLLRHTSGIEGDRGYMRTGLQDRDTCARYILNCKMASTPGEKWYYNNMGYFLLAALVEVVSKESWEDFVYDKLLKPAGMVEAGCIGAKHLDYDRVPQEHRGRGRMKFAYGRHLTWGYRGAGGVVASVFDMERWHQALRGDKILDKKAKKDFYAPGKKVKVFHEEHGRYACGWCIEETRDGKRVAFHSGNTGSVVTFYLRHLDEDVVVAIACNYRPPEDPKIIAKDLSRLARTTPTTETAAKLSDSDGASTTQRPSSRPKARTNTSSKTQSGTSADSKALRAALLATARARSIAFKSRESTELGVAFMPPGADRAPIKIEGTVAGDLISATVDGEHAIVFQGRSMVARHGSNAWKLCSGFLADGTRLPHVCDPCTALASLAKLPLAVSHVCEDTRSDRPSKTYTVTSERESAAQLVWSGISPRHAIARFSMGGPGAGSPLDDLKVDLAVTVDSALGIVRSIRFRSYQEINLPMGVPGGPGGPGMPPGPGGPEGPEDPTGDPADTDKPEEKTSASGKLELKNGLPVRSRDGALCVDFDLYLSRHDKVGKPAVDQAALQLLRYFR